MMITPLAALLFTVQTYSADESLVVTENGNVGIGTANPSAALDVKGLFKADTANGVVQTSQFVKEFSGVIAGTGNYPDCTNLHKIVTLGKIKKSNWGFIEVTVYSTHQGYNNTGYYDYKKWVIMAGTRLSSNLVESAGNSSGYYGPANTPNYALNDSTVVNLYDGENEGNYGDFCDANNATYCPTIISDEGFDIQLKVDPHCGSTMKHTYVVRYSSTLNFTPDPKRSW